MELVTKSKQEQEEFIREIASYITGKSTPIQIAGDDTIGENYFKDEDDVRSNK